MTVLHRVVRVAPGLAAAGLVATALATSAAPALAADRVPGADAVVDAAAATVATPAPFRLVSAEAVAEDVLAGRVHVLDTRPFGAYLAGHVPGAVHLDDERMRGPVAGRPVQFLPADAAAGELAAAGVRPDRPVLVHAGTDDPLAATLVAYILLRTGHPEVMLLDGGWDAWAANHPVSRALPAPAGPESLEVPGAAGVPGPSATSSASAAAAFAPAEPHVAWATLAAIRPEIGWNETLFVDARPARHYRGEVAAWPRSGHIPGAVSLDWKRLTEPDNPHRLRPIADLRRIVHEDAGLEVDAEVVTYCGTGREATLLTLVLRHVLGMPNVRLFEGSWTEYSADASLPAERGTRGPLRVRVHRDGPMSFSGQPDLATLDWLAAEGVATIVNVRSTREVAERMPYDEAAITSRGLRSLHVPLGGDDGYDPAAVDALARAIDAADGPVHVHCSSGGRARTLYTAYLVRHRGMDLAEAVDHVNGLGGGPSSLERLLGERLSVQRTGARLEDPASRDGR